MIMEWSLHSRKRWGISNLVQASEYVIKRENNFKIRKKRELLFLHMIRNKLYLLSLQII